MREIAFCGGMTTTGMADATDQLIDVFVANLMASGVPVRRDDNSSRLQTLESKLPRRLPISFTSLLSRYSFPSFDSGGISFFSWESANTDFSEVVPPTKGSLSELLLPSGYLQIGRPNTGDFDAVCFDFKTQEKNREYRIVQADHEEILCNLRVKIRKELWPSFHKLVEHQVSMR
jgi:hypothetical protein